MLTSVTSDVRHLDCTKYSSAQGQLDVGRT